MDGSDQVHLPTLLNIAYPELDPARARMAICRGNVSINGVTIALPDMDMSREQLRSATIRCGRRPPFVIDEHGRHILRHPPREEADPSQETGQHRLL